MVTAINSVQTKDNSLLYSGAGAALGAAAGGSLGYLRKPYLKDNKLTDEFLNIADACLSKEAQAEADATLRMMKFNREVSDNFIENMRKTSFTNEAVQSDYRKAYTEFIKSPQTTKAQKAIFKRLKDAKSLDEIAQIIKKEKNKICKFINVPRTLKEISSSPEQREKDWLKEHIKIFKNSPWFKEKECVKNLKKATCAEELISTIENEISNKEAEIRKMFIDSCWDSNRKTFRNLDDPIGQSVKKTAQNMRIKSALLFGAIAAGAIGLLTYAFCKSKSQPDIAAQKKVNTKA